MEEIKIDQVLGLGEKSEEAKLAMDIFETSDLFVIVVPLAGVPLQNIKIHVSEDVLSLSGTRDFPQEFADFGEKVFFLQECYWGKFSRSIVLPAIASSAEIQAKMRDGILYITMPKARKAHEKSVSIEMQ
ncbi:MAG: Hsp20/alpha crystallin family protein [Candidatus Peregrinibacteria bacterium]